MRGDRGAKSRPGKEQALRVTLNDLRPTRLKNTLLLAGTIVVLFAVLEIVLRVVYHPANLEPVIRFDETLGWALKPDTNLRSVDEKLGLDYRIQTNSKGMREREFPLEKKQGAKRVLIIGDSIAFGTGVNAEQRFSDFLSRAFGEDVEVVNAAVSGWGTDQELLYYEETGRTLGPDLVIVAFTMANDVLNNMLDHLFLGSASKPRFFLRDGELVLERPKLESPSPRLGDRIRATMRKSRVLLFVKRRIDMLGYEEQVKHASVKVHGGFDKEGLENNYSHWSVYEATYGQRFEEAWEVTESVIDRLSHRCAENGAELVVFAFPLKLEVDDRWRRSLFRHFDIDSTLLDFTKPYERLSRFCAERGIEFVYPLETFRGASRSRALYFERDSHPNAYGHAAAARVLLDVLHDHLLLNYRVAEGDRAYLPATVGDEMGKGAALPAEQRNPH